VHAVQREEVVGAVLRDGRVREEVDLRNAERENGVSARRAKSHDRNTETEGARSYRGDARTAVHAPPIFAKVLQVLQVLCLEQVVSMCSQNPSVLSLEQAR